MKNLFGFVFLIMSYPGLAQSSYSTINVPNLAPASPNAFQIAQYGNVPVGLTSGSAQFNIDLYTIQSRKLSLPISLNYNSNGVKVDLPSSRAGNGWVFNAGGVITRTAFGDDDIETAVPRPAIPSSLTTPTNALRDFLETVYQNDIQRDQYSFNFPGYSGKFIIRNNEIIITPHLPNVKVQFDALRTDWNFLITTPDGVKYFFGGNAAREKSETQNGGVNCTPGPDLEFDNAWYLTKILHPSGDQIELKYNSVYFNYISGVSQSVVRPYPTVQSPFVCSGSETIYMPNGASNSFCYPLMINTGKILSEITFSDGRVRFYNKTRSDISNDSCIDKIEVFNQDNRLVKRFLFTHVYADCNNTFDNPTVPGSDLRLFLAKFEEVDPLGSSQKVAYQFEYNDKNGLPARLSFAQDHYGYFNGKQNSQFVPTNTDFGGIFSGYGGNRDPDSNYSSKGMLTKIIYPTGGSSEIEYEPNYVKGNLLGGSASVLMDAGGVRVKRIKTRDSVTSVLQIKRYYYHNLNDWGGSSGTLGWRANYVTDKIIRVNCSGSQGGACLYKDFTFKALNSNSQFGIYGTSNGSVLYSHVLESHGENFENGGTLTEFVAVEDGLANVVYGNYIPNAAGTSFGFNNGLQKYRLQFKMASGQVVKLKEEFFKYKSTNDASGITNNSYRTDTVVVVNPKAWLQCPPSTMSSEELSGYDINLYYIFSYFTHLDSLITIDYNGPNSLVIAKKFFYDNATRLQITKEQFIDSKGDTIKKEFLYPYDYAVPGNVYKEMVDSNIVSPIVEDRYKVNGVNEVITYNNFQKINSTPANFDLSTTDQKIGNSAQEVRILYSQYDQSGNIAEMKNTDGILHSYLWNYNNTLPDAHAINASVSSIAYASFEADGKGNWTYTGPALSDISAPTGKKCYNLSGGQIQKSGLSSGNSYILSYWYKGGHSLTITGGTQTNILTGQTINGWTYTQRKITGTTSVSLSGSGNIDELRLYPANAQMTTNTYLPLVGITAQCDISNNITYYEYDELQRLILIRDHDKRIVKKICYNYAGQPEYCSIFYNVEKSGVFTRSCAPPNTGSQVTYTVPAGTYNSTESQSKADVMAQNDVNTNGQAYANSNGTCTYICSPSNCIGQEMKCVNNVCEAGIKIYTSSVYIPETNMYECTYHYEWGDGSWSADYVEQSAGGCPVS